MAEGFKKYFNGTTMSGRANVAKATYATLALLYIFYRMRRGSGKQSELASDNCSCDAEAEPMPHGDTGIYGSDPDCSVCRDRSERAMSEYDREQRRKAAAEDNGCRDDPPPPPPSNGGSARPRAKCPCEDSQKRVNGAMKTNNNNNTSHSRAWSHQLQPPNQYRQHFQQHVAPAPPPSEEENPVSELMEQVHDVVARVVRGVVGAVLGGAAVSTTGSSSSSSSSSCVGETQSHIHSQSYYEQDEDEEEDDEEGEEEEEEWEDSQAFGSRNNPLFCTPTANNTGMSSKPMEAGANDNYNAFSDGFASDMFFKSDAK